MENENKKKGRSVFNLFDLALILIAAALGVILFLGSRQQPAEGQETPVILGQKVSMRYSLELTSVEQSVVDLFREGDPLIDKEKKYSLGTVESVEVSPSKRTVNDYENGRIVYAEEPGRYSLIVTIKTEGEIGERNITLDGGYLLRVGKSVYGKLPTGVFRATVVAIEREEK